SSIAQSDVRAPMCVHVTRQESSSSGGTCVAPSSDMMRAYFFAFPEVTRLVIHEPLSADALQDHGHALGIVVANLDELAVNFRDRLAIVPAKVKLVRIALEMTFADIVKRAVQPALE